MSYRFQLVGLVFILIFGLSKLAHAGPKLVARSSLISSYRMPVPSALANTNLVLNERGQLSFKYVALNKTTGLSEQRIWFDGKEIFSAPDDLLITDPSFAGDDHLLFSLYDFNYNGGLWRIGTETGTLQEILSAAQRPELTLFNFLDGNGLGDIFWRGLRREGGYSLHLRNIFQGQEQVLLAHGQTLPFYPEDKVELIFSPSYADGFIASKLWLGEDQKEVIVLWHKGHPQLITSNEGGQFLSFNNNLGLNRLGDLVFIANFKNAKGQRERGIFHYQKSTQTMTEISRSSEGILGELETFAPVLNDKGVVIFRSFNAEGKRAIFSWKQGQELRQLIAEGDIVTLEDGVLARIKHDIRSPGLSGRPVINQAGELAFVAALEALENGFSLGHGVFFWSDF